MATESEELELEKDFQNVCLEERTLTEEEQNKLENDAVVVNAFKQNKLEKEALKNWDLFYKRNTTKFFKDRHWTQREFEELTQSSQDSCHNDPTTTRWPPVYFEVGCGVGNFMFPLIADDKSCHFVACDFSPRAVEFVKSNPNFDTSRCTAFQCDVTVDNLLDKYPNPCSVDVATFIFVLSAIHPDKMVAAVENVMQTLRPGGMLLIRDYGLYDHAMLRFSKGHKLAENFYVRQDGTRAYYFSLDKLEEVMLSAGLEKIDCRYVRRSTINKKENIDVSRTFIQGKFRKPLPLATESSGAVLLLDGQSSDVNTPCEHDQSEKK